MPLRLLKPEVLAAPLKIDFSLRPWHPDNHKVARAGGGSVRRSSTDGLAPAAGGQNRVGVAGFRAMADGDPSHEQEQHHGRDFYQPRGFPQHRTSEQQERGRLACHSQRFQQNRVP